MTHRRNSVLHFLKSFQVTSCVILGLALQSSAQVYNYNHLGYTNPEVFAASLSNTELSNFIRVTHLNNFPISNSMSDADISIGKSLGSGLYGIGVGYRRVSFGSDDKYQSISLSGAYRTAILAKIIVRMGASYKLNRDRSKSSRFGYYTSTAMGTEILARTSNNANLNVSFSDRGHKYIIAGGIMNLALPTFSSPADSIFHTYSFAQIGKGVRRMGGRDELTLTYQQEKSGTNTKPYHSLYINYDWAGKPIDRNLTVKVAIRAGYLINRWVQISPRLALVGQKYAIWLSSDHALRSKSDPRPYKTSITIGLHFKLPK